jgi:hypothetical protein
VADPGSLLTWMRWRLSRWLEPEPDPGEAWCMECALNGGRTLLLPADGHEIHAERHGELPGTGVVIMRVRWPDP